MSSLKRQQLWEAGKVGLLGSCLGWASLAMDTLVQLHRQLQHWSFQGQVLHWRPKKGLRTRWKLGSPSRSGIWCLDSWLQGGSPPGHLATNLLLTQNGCAKLFLSAARGRETCCDTQHGVSLEQCWWLKDVFPRPCSAEVWGGSSPTGKSFCSLPCESCPPP